MRIAFYGSPEAATPYLRMLAKRHQVVAVVTQPGKPAGRGLELRPSAVKAAAAGLGLEVLEPQRPSESVERLKALAPDLAVAVAYGKLLKADALAVPRLGTLNVHYSLLPKYRGAAPVQWALARGEARTGVSVFWLDEGMDTGPLYSSRGLDVGRDEDAGSLLGRLTALGVAALEEAVEGIAAGRVLREPQSGEASLAPKIKREDARIHWGMKARDVHNLARAMILWPKAYAELEKGCLGILKTALHDQKDGLDSAGSSPGRILRIDRACGILVQCSDDPLWLVTVQPEGKKPVPAADFLNGLRLREGDFLPKRL